ncbi:MAG: hypothetical protein LBI77_03245 [Puniceicoccales bacterium]|jgi:hypothetical protein|nr:hypothetical protein [Puniceicoccales bacterium]
MENSSLGMKCKVIGVKSSIGGILLIFFHIHLQASEGEFSCSTCLGSLEVMESSVEMCTHIHEAQYHTLTPKEKEIADLTKYRFFQLQHNSLTFETPSIGLCAIIDLRDRLMNDSDELLFTSCEKLRKVAESLPDTLPNSVAEASRLINRPVLYVEVGNHFCSFGPIDVARRIIFAKPSEFGDNVELLSRKSRLRDNELISLIRSSKDDAIIVCYNSYLKRSIFSLPKESGKVLVAKDSDMETQKERKVAILKIKGERFRRNAAILTVPFLVASSFYWKKSILQFPVAKQMSSGISMVGNFFRKFGRKISGFLCSNFCPSEEIIDIWL